MIAEASFTGFPFPSAHVEKPLPVLLAGLVFWLDATRGVSLDGASSRVAGWGSRVGSTAAVQGTPAAMPLLVASALNGLPGVRLDGADDYLEIAMPTGLGPLGTVYAVVSGLDGVNGYKTLLSGQGQWRIQTNNLEIVGQGGFNFMLSAGAHLLVATFGDATHLTLLNVDGTTVATSGLGPSGAPTAFDVGRNVASGGLDYGNMTFHEILYYSAVPSISDGSRIRTYLAAKWGLA